jgi:hypothetical protein
MHQRDATHLTIIMTQKSRTRHAQGSFPPVEAPSPAALLSSSQSIIHGWKREIPRIDRPQHGNPARCGLRKRGWRLAVSTAGAKGLAHSVGVAAAIPSLADAGFIPVRRPNHFNPLVLLSSQPIYCAGHAGVRVTSLRFGAPPFVGKLGIVRPQNVREPPLLRADDRDSSCPTSRQSRVITVLSMR